MIPKHLRVLSFLLVAGALGFAVAADSTSADNPPSSGDTPNTFELDRVNVKAKRLKEKPESPYAVTESSELHTQVITKEDIEALNPKTTWEILEQIPGFQVQEASSQHQEWYYFQGTQSAFGVLVDGVYLTQLDRVISSLPPSAIESVTVVRDATALTLGPLTNFSAWGSGSAGGGTGAGNMGFVLIKTRRAAKKEGEVSARYGSYSAEKYNLSLGNRTGKFDYRISGSYSNDPGKTGWHMEERSTAIFFDAGSTTDTFEASFLYAWEHGKKDSRLDLKPYPNVTSGAYDYSTVGTMVPASGGSPSFPRVDVEMAALTMTQHWNSHHATTASFGYGGNAIAMSSNGTAESDTSYSTTFSLRHVIATDSNTFKAGVQRFTYLAPRKMGGGSWGRDVEKMTGFFVEDEHRFFGGKLSVDGGVRVDQKVFDSGWLQGAKGGQTKAKTSPAVSLGASLKAIPRLTLTTRVSHTENDPSNYQYTTTPGDGPSTLHTEKRNRLEVGALASLHPAFNPFATAYVYTTKYQKVIVGNTGTMIDGVEYDKVTEQGVQTHGIDMGASGRILAPLDYQFTWSAFGDNISGNTSIARHTGNASLRYHQGPFSANASARYVGPIQNSSGLTGIAAYPLGDYTRLDANVSYDFKFQGKDSKVMIFGRNLTDKHYANRVNGSGSSTTISIDPGLTYGVQVSCKFF